MVPEEINGKQVTGICSGAFYQCAGLTRVSLPESITRIEKRTFYGCGSLSGVEYPGEITYIGDSAFYNCKELNGLTFPESLEYIGSEAFFRCGKLTGTIVLTGVSEIGEEAFYGTFVSNVSIQGGITTIGEGTFRECSLLTDIELPDSLIKIGDSAFRDCDSLPSISLPEGVTEIGSYAFEGCEKLKNIQLPETLTIIGRYAFIECKSLENLTLPKGVTEIHPYAFYGCEGLTNVEIQGGLVTIGDSAFDSCGKLRDISLPETVTSIGRRAFGDCVSLTSAVLPQNVNEISDNLFNGCTALKTVDVRGNVTAVGSGAFSGCVNLEEISLPESLERIDSSAFYNCASLGRISLPDTLRSIGSYAFYSCASLRYFTIPSAVEEIGSYAFFGCEALEELALPEKVTSIADGTFSGCENLSILYIPESVTSIDDHLAKLTELLLNVEPDTYGEEFAIEHGMRYVYGNSLEGGILNVLLDPKEEWEAYEGLTLTVSLGGSGISQKITGNRSYRFPSLPADETCSVTLRNQYGDVLAERNGITVKKGEQTVTISQPVPVADICVTVLGKELRDVTDRTDIEWRDENGTLYGSGAVLKGVPIGKRIVCRTRLDDTLGKQYIAPQDTVWTAAAEDSDYMIYLKSFQKRTVSGSVVDEQGAVVVGASVAVSQSLNGKYRVDQTVLTAADGSFSAEIYSSSAELTVDAYGYSSRKLSLEESEENQDLGPIELTPVDGSRLTLRIKYTAAVSEGQSAKGQMISQWDDLDFQIDNTTTGDTALSYIRQKGELIVTDPVSPGDVLRVTVSSLSKDFAAKECEILLDAEGDGMAAVELTQYGAVRGTCDSGQNAAVRMCVYDEKGGLTWTGLYENSVLQSGPLPSGTYTVAVMGEAKFLPYPGSLEALEKTGYQEGRDYKSGQLSVIDGIISGLDLGTIPLLEEERFYYTRQDQTLFQTNKTDVAVGRSFTVRAQASWKEAYQDRISDIKWIFDIPEGCVYVNGTLSADGELCAGAEFGDTRITVPVADASSLIRLCLMASEQGTYRINGFLQFTLDGEEILQPVGTAEVKAGELSFQICDRTNTKLVSASGVAPAWADIKIYDNDVLVGITSSNNSGQWSADFELYQPYTYSTHKIYASIMTREGVTLRTGTKELLYQYSASPVAVKRVKMIYGQYTVDFDFTGNEAAGSRYYSFSSGNLSFTFQVEFEGEDLSTVRNVRLDVLCSNGKTETLYLTKSESDETWFGCVSDRFYSSNLPVNVTVRYDYDAGFVFSREEQADQAIQWNELTEGWEDPDEIWEPLETEEALEADEELEQMEDYLEYLQEEQGLEKELEEYNLYVASVKVSYDALMKSVEDLGKPTKTADGGVKISTPAGEVEIGQSSGMTAGDLTGQGYTEVPATAGDSVYVSPEGTVIADLDEGVIIRSSPIQTSDQGGSGSGSQTPGQGGDGSGSQTPGQEGSGSGSQTPGQGESGSDSQTPGIDAQTAENTWGDIQNRLDQVADAYSDFSERIGYVDNGYQAIPERWLAAHDRMDRRYKKLSEISERVADYYDNKLAHAASSDESLRYLRGYETWSTKANQYQAQRNALQHTANSLEKFARVLGVVDIPAQLYSMGRYYQEQMERIDALEANTDSQEVKDACKRLRYQLYGYIAAQIALLAARVQNPLLAIGVGLASGYAENLFKEQFEERLRKVAGMVLDPAYTVSNPGAPAVGIIDPSGYVYEAVPSNRLSGVTATCYEKVTKYDQYEEAYEEIQFWEAGEYSQQNPLITDAQGRYAWDVPDGKWQIKYEKEGYETAYSQWMDVPPPRFDVNIGLVSYEAPAVTEVHADPSGVEIVFSKYIRSGSLTNSSILVMAGGKVLSGAIVLENGEENPEKAEELLASRIRFVPEEELEEGAELTVTVSNTVCSYAGVRMDAKSVNTVTVKVSPETLSADDQILIPFSGFGIITLQALPASAAAGSQVELENGESMIFSPEQSAVSLDENGRAEISVRGLISGEGELSFRLTGTNLTATTRITVSLPSAETPAASIASGQTEKGTVVTLSCGTDNANIFYTLDGSDPISSGTRMKYAGAPIVLEEDCVLQAVAVREGMADSEVARYEYTVRQPAGCEIGDHTWVWVTDREATCGSDGSRHQECEVCKEQGETEVIPATGDHTWNVIVDREATCGSDGSRHQECEVCKEQGETEVIPATGDHTWNVIVDCEATCSAAGSQHEECAVCHQKGAVTELPATDHTWTMIVDREATCGTTGSQHKECTVCHQKGEVTELPATENHTWTVVVDRAATCGSAGSQHKECTVCHQKEAVTELPATGNHTWTVIVDQAATCGAAGSQHKECTVCHQKGEAAAISVTGNHTWTVVVDRKATCGSAGSQHRECAVCHQKEAATAIPATGKHSWSSYAVSKKATAVAAGSETRTCSVCQKKETRVIKKLPATVKLTVSKLPLQVKKSVNLKQIVTGLAEGDSIKAWKTSDKKIATVSASGKVTGKKAGKAKITVTLASGKSASLTVTVQKATVTTTKIGNIPKTLSMSKGQKVSLLPVLTPISSLQKVTYKTSNKKIVTVDKKGVLSAKAAGKAKITVTSGKKKATVTVTVKKTAVTAIKNVPEKLSLKKGKSYSLKPKLVPSGAEDKLTYTSSNKKVATVTAKGKITGKKAGTATITVKAGTVSVKCKITVK